MLTIPSSQLGYVITKAREYDAEVAPVEDTPPHVEHEHSILEATTDNPTRQELIAAIRNMNDDDRIQLIAPMYRAASPTPQRSGGRRPTVSSRP